MNTATTLYHRNGKECFLSAIILFYLSQPYFFWSGFFANIYIKTILSFLLGWLFLKNKKKYDRTDNLLQLLFSIALILYVVTGGHNINFFLYTFPVILLPFARDDFNQKVYQYFLRIYVAVISVSLVFWLLAVLGIISPYTTIPPLNSLKSGNYYVYPFLVTETLPVIRFTGVFDEPGVVGTLSGIMLCIEKFNIKNKKGLILLISGLCSLSLFFYVLIGLYFAFYYLVEKRSLVKGLGIITIILIVIYALQNNPFLNEVLGSRLELNAETGKLSGDNRTDQDIIDYYIVQSAIAGTLWTGIENKASFLNDVEGGSSIYFIIIVNGLLFFLFYVGFFIAYGWYYRNSIPTFILFLFVFFGTIYQRPNTFVMLYVFLFIILARSKRQSRILSL